VGGAKGGVAVTVAELQRLLAKAEKASAKACSARATLPPGSSRARVTSANAKWARAAEHRDIIAAMLADAQAEVKPDAE
jgi:hypothetical protein